MVQYWKMSLSLPDPLRVFPPCLSLVPRVTEPLAPREVTVSEGWQVEPAGFLQGVSRGVKVL